jgi:RimJ/RimL family protein N-acetyltransferase
MTSLRTDRLVLRSANPADVEPMHAILRNEIAMAYWSSPPHETEQQTREWLEAMIAVPPNEGEDFIVEHDGRVIGKAGLYRFPEIGYIFHPDAWGQGFAAEALRSVIDRAFVTHGLNGVEADVDPRNVRSLRLLARLGFEETGRKANTWCVGGAWCDSVYLRLAPADWRRVG